VPDARRIGTLSYEETQEMAESGAKVLNAQAVEFAKERGIAIYARAASSPLPGDDPSADGTVVRRDAPRTAGSVVGVASERDTLLIQLDGAIDEFLGILDAHGAPGKQLHQVDGRLTLIVSRENLHEEERLRSAIGKQFGGTVRVADELGAVSVVGAGINASFENLRRGAAALKDAGIVHRAAATSSFRITWMIDRTRLHDAVRLLHQTFIT
jgi:aspartate kinase